MACFGAYRSQSLDSMDSMPDLSLGTLGPSPGPVLAWPRRDRAGQAKGAVDKHTQTPAYELCLSLNNMSMNTAADVTDAAAPSPSPARATQTPRRNLPCTGCLNLCPMPALPALPAGSPSPDGILARTAARTERRDSRGAECAACVWLLVVTHRLAG